MVPAGLAGLTSIGYLMWPKATWAQEFARPNAIWTEEDFNHFLSAVNPSEGGALMASIEKKSYDYSASAVRGHLNWLRYHTFDPRAHLAETVDYHEIASWVAKTECGADQDLVDSATTFELERMVTEHSISRMWEGLSTEQRTEALAEVHADGTPEDGSELLSVLGKYERWNQRRYYESLLKTAESCYMGYKSLARSPSIQGALATRLQAVNVHPVIWVTGILIAVASIGYMLGRASPRKTSVVVTQMHLIKVAALEDAGVLNGIIADLKIS